MTQPTNTNDTAVLKKFAKIVLTIAAVAGTLGGIFNAITVYQVSTAIGHAGAGVLFQAFFAFVFSFFVYGFVFTIGAVVLTVFATAIYMLFRGKPSSGPTPGSGGDAK